VILGREPALWAAAAKALVAVISLFVINLTMDQQGAINAFVAVLLGVIVAFTVASEKAVPLIVGLVEAGIYLAVAFGWNVSADKQTVLLTLIGAIVAIITRDRVVAPVDPAGNRVPDADARRV
jgi:nicotinamide riboside transporter PnuC